MENVKSLGFYSRLFLVPKPHRRCRPVIDLSRLNTFLLVERFKMETPESIRACLIPSKWVSWIDLSDAYLHITIHPNSRKYLRFCHKSQVFRFTSLPSLGGDVRSPVEDHDMVPSLSVTLKARHIPGCLNVMADLLSRSNQVHSTEWSLHPQVFKQICHKWFTPHVDLFATRVNHKVPPYVSPVPDQNAWDMETGRVSLLMLTLPWLSFTG